MNAIDRLRFELAYLEGAVHLFRYYATGIYPHCEIIRVINYIIYYFIYSVKLLVS